MGPICTALEDSRVMAGTLNNVSVIETPSVHVYMGVRVNFIDGPWMCSLNFLNL